MATKTLQFPPEFWDDEALAEVSPLGQVVHIRLMGMPNVSAAGTMPYVPGRYAGRCLLDRDAVVAAINELSVAGFAVVDEREDLLLTQFMTYQRIGGQPRRIASARDALAQMAPGRVLEAGEIALQAEIDRAAGVKRKPASWRVRVFDRDGWRCVECCWAPGDPVPPAPSGRSLHRGLEVDHIHPKSKGGADSMDNYQTLCSSCNARKGARV